MKKKYKIKSNCSHCGFDFEFWNTDKMEYQEVQSGLPDADGTQPVIGREVIIECPNCGSKITWDYQSLYLILKW